MSRLLRYFAVVSLLVLSQAGCSDSDVDSSEGDDSQTEIETPSEVIKWIDQTLSKSYLYNDDYSALTGRFFTDKYDDFFYTNLMRLKTNTLDKKSTQSAYGSVSNLFSYVLREDLGSKSRSGLSAERSDYGVSMLEAVKFRGQPVLYVLAVYGGSPACDVELCRGALITRVNGIEVKETNYTALMNTILEPSKGESVEIDWMDSYTTTRSESLIATTYAANSVLRSEIILQNGERVGYLNYLSFDYAYNDELLDSFKMMREGGAEHLILDLRYNRGGYVSSASSLTSAIVGADRGSNQVFSYYRYNDDLTRDYKGTTRWIGVKYDENAPNESAPFYEYLSGVDEESQLQLSDKTIYILTGSNTASASEMVINSLKGIDGFDVVQIGEKTRGKNVGMLVSTKRFGDYSYELAPVTFENFNCDGVGGYEDGIAPDYEITSVASLTVFDDFTRSDKLVAKALDLISPTVDWRTQSVASKSVGNESVMSILGAEQRGSANGISGAIKRVEE